MSSRRVFTWLLASLLLLAVVQLVAGAVASGVTNDEPIHVLRAQGWLDFGWYSPGLLLVNGEPSPAAGTTIFSPYVYGPAFSAIAHLANLAGGFDPAGRISDSSGAWVVRHLVTAVIGLAAAIAAGASVRSLTGSWRFGLWTVVCLLAIPLWTGMSFFNPKDLPAAAGYTLVTAALVIALGSAAPAIGRRYLRPGLIGLMLAGGVYLGAGTRLALWLPIALSVLTWALLAWGRSRSGNPGRNRDNTIAVALGILVGALALIIVYPVLLDHPRDFLFDSLRDSSGFPWTGTTLTAGRQLSGDPPIWYLPVWGFASVPVLIGLLAFAGLCLTMRDWIRTLVNNGPGRLEALAGRRDIALLLVLQQLLLLSVGSIVLGSSMYSGLRQHLYILPAVAMLAGIGAHRLWVHFGQRPGRGRGKRIATTALISLALVVPLAEGALLFPLNYTYINPVAGIGGINDNWETDYWWSSLRAALDEVPKGSVPGCSATLNRPADPTANLTVSPCADFWGERQSGPATTTGPEPSVWVLGRKRADNVIPAFCQVENEITRWVRGEEVVMSYVLRCDSSRVVTGG